MLKAKQSPHFVGISAKGATYSLSQDMKVEFLKAAIWVIFFISSTIESVDSVKFISFRKFCLWTKSKIWRIFNLKKKNLCNSTLKWNFYFILLLFITVFMIVFIDIKIIYSINTGNIELWTDCDSRKVDFFNAMLIFTKFDINFSTRKFLKKFHYQG